MQTTLLLGRQTRIVAWTCWFNPSLRVFDETGYSTGLIKRRLIEDVAVGNADLIERIALEMETLWQDTFNRFRTKRECTLLGCNIDKGIIDPNAKKSLFSA